MHLPAVLASFLVAGSILVPAPAVAVAGASSAPAPAGPAPLVVELTPGASPEEVQADLDEAGLTVVDQAPGSDFVLAVAQPGASPSPGGVIEDVDPIVTYRAFGVPNDPGYEYQWHLPLIGAPAAWDVTTGAGTVVAVLDSGVAYESHLGFLRAPDLAGTRFAPGWDFVDGDAHPNDENSHGTHVASVIAATTNNGFGVAGVAPSTTIMPLRVLDGGGAGSDWAAAQALRFAADHGADVANLSFGSPVPSDVMADAVAYARTRGVVVVAAAGNQGAAVSYPAAFASVVAVGSVRFDLTRASYSNFGPSIDLVAPGGDTTVDQNLDDYGDGILQEGFDNGDPTSFGFFFVDGTSSAAPQVTGVAALVASRGVADPAVIESVLVSTAQDLGPQGRDDEFGAGLVRADAAVRALLPGQAPPAQVLGIEHACPPDVTPAPPFTDLGGTVHAAAIGCVAWWGVADGKTPTRFDPNGRMTRAQLASFMARTLDAAGATLPSSPPDAFTDDDTSVHERAINQLAALGVVQGRSSGTYGPGATVTRAEMATFLVRVHDRLAAAPLPTGTDRFVDDSTSVHQANINKVAAAGIAAGVSSTRFAPSSPVVRGQMATFIARLLDLLVTTAPAG